MPLVGSTGRLAEAGITRVAGRMIGAAVTGAGDCERGAAFCSAGRRSISLRALEAAGRWL